MRYVTLSELIYINGRLLNNDQIMTGKRKVRDVELLDAAAMRPAASAFGADAFPTLRDKAAALLHAVARNHPFADGNKRTATVAALFMLRVNGERAVWQPADALAMILSAAEGRIEVDALAGWFPLEPCPPLPDADLDTDTRLIADLLLEHKALLDELALQ